MKKTGITLILIFTLLLTTACAGTQLAGPKRYEAEFLNLFDTFTQLVGYTADKKTFEKQAQFIHDELEVYHQLFDIYNDYEGVNNLKTINDHAGISPVKVDKKIIDLLEFSKEVYRLTGGKVNVAFGSVLSVWHDYRDAGIDNPEEAQLPPMELLQEAAAHTDINKVILDRENSTVYLADADMSLDVGAVAKGYATEAVCGEAVKRAGVTSMLVSVGGNVRAIGDKDGKGSKWSVGIQNPDESAPEEEAMLETVAIADLSLVTSGDYQRYYTVGGKRYNHIIDPATLMPAEGFRSVTILCRDSGMADALSTAAFLMDSESGMALVRSVEGAEAIYVMPDGSLQQTEGFAALTQPAKK